MSEQETSLQDEEIRGETTWEESPEEGDSDVTDSGGDSDGTDSGDSDGMDSGDSDGTDSDSDGSDS